MVSVSLIGSAAIMRTHAPVAALDHTPALNNCVAVVWHDLTAGPPGSIHPPQRRLSFACPLVWSAWPLHDPGCFGPLIAILRRSSPRARALGRVRHRQRDGRGRARRWGLQANPSPAFHPTRSSTPAPSGLAAIRRRAVLIPMGMASSTYCFTPLGKFVMRFAFAAIIVPAQTPTQQEAPHALDDGADSSRTVMSVVFFAQLLGLVLSGISRSSSACARCSCCCAALAGTLAIAGRLFRVSSARSTRPGPDSIACPTPAAFSSIRALTSFRTTDLRQRAVRLEVEIVPLLVSRSGQVALVPLDHCAAEEIKRAVVAGVT